MTVALQFYGAAGEVTGSCHVLTVGDSRVLLDCGMIQGGRKAEQRNREPFPFPVGEIDAVVLSHAHLDHSGRLPLMHKRGFRGTVHTHAASRDLCAILLRDAASLAERDAEYLSRKRARQGKAPVKPLYTVDEANETIGLLRGHRYETPVQVTPEISVRFYDAGHILGSASVQVTINHGSLKRTLLFSGDLGQYATPILNDPVSPRGNDLVLMESTYGDRRHRDRESTYRELGDILLTAAADGGNIIIPAFAIGRSQELLYLLGKNRESWQVDRWKIFLDSPMAIEASEVYWDYPQLYDREARLLRGDADRMPELDNLFLTRTTAESRVINRLQRGALIIAGSGMCTGGRVLHHLKNNLWRRNAHVIIVGYQARGTLGRQLVDGAQEVRIYGETIHVGASVHTIGGLSAHGDKDDLSRWYGALGDAPPVWLVHGEPDASEQLAIKLRNEHGSRVSIAAAGDNIDLETLH